MKREAILGAWLAAAVAFAAAPALSQGGSPSKSPGRTKYEPITVQRGVTQDPGFGNWAGSGSGTPKSPGRTKYGPITVQRGVIHDTGFAGWASASGKSTKTVRPCKGRPASKACRG